MKVRARIITALSLAGIIASGCGQQAAPPITQMPAAAQSKQHAQDAANYAAYMSRQRQQGR